MRPGSNHNDCSKGEEKMAYAETYYSAQVGSDHPLYIHPSSGKPYFAKPGEATELDKYILGLAPDFQGQPDIWDADEDDQLILDGADGSTLYAKFRENEWCCPGGWQWIVQSSKP